MARRTNATLKQIKIAFTNNNQSSSFSNAAQVAFNLEQRGLYAPRSKINKVLRELKAHTNSKKVIYNFKRQPITPLALNESFSMDLLFMREYKRYNDNVQYLLVVVNDFSRFVKVAPCRTKNAAEIAGHLETILDEFNLDFSRCFADDGTEFKSYTQQLLNQRNIQKITLKEPIKASIAENLNKTIKMRISRYQDHQQKYRYIDKLPKIVHNINNSYNRAIKAVPAKISKANEKQLFKTIYLPKLLKSLVKTTKPKFKVGMQVRVAKKKTLFNTRAYDLRWGYKTYHIHTVIPTTPVRYILRDYYGIVGKRKYYEYELQHVKASDVVPIEVIRQQGDFVIVRFQDDEGDKTHKILAKDIQKL